MCFGLTTGSPTSLDRKTKRQSDPTPFGFKGSYRAMITGLCACVVGPSITSERCLDVCGALLAVVASACVTGRVSVSRLEQKSPWHHLRLHRCPPKRLAETAFYPPEGFTVGQSLQSDSFYSVLEQMAPVSPPSRPWKQGSLSFLMILRGQVDLLETQRQNKIDLTDCQYTVHYWSKLSMNLQLLLVTKQL